MIWKLSLVLSVASCVISGKPAISEQTLERFHTGHHGDLSHIGDHEPEHHEVYAWAYPSYEFSYHVDDPHTHDKKAQQEVRDGDVVTGSYWFIQPDGYKRVVKYRADKKSGFEADVNYIPVDKHHEKKVHHEKREHKEEHKAAESHDVTYERRHQGHNDKRRHDHHHDVHEHYDKQKEESLGYNHEIREDHRKYEDKEDLIPQIHRHEIRKSHEKHDRKVERRPQLHHHQIKEHHNKGEHKDEPKNISHHDSHDENHDKLGHSRDFRRDDDVQHDDHHVEHFWRGTYGKGKEAEEHTDRHRPEHGKNENWGWKRGHSEEHWKHGRLVGWREERVSTSPFLNSHDKRSHYNNRGPQNHEIVDHRDDQKHDDYHRGQYSSQKPVKNFKPLIPYGQRLH